MINNIIFSKDRACQLDLFLRSIIHNVRDYKRLTWTIIYLASTPEYEEGYEKVKKRFPNFSFINEMVKGFRNTTIDYLYTLPYHQFFVDDDCFKEKWDPFDSKLDLLQTPEILTISLRMDPKYNYCYTQKRMTPPPSFINNLRWYWEKLDGDWGYPMSLDGHIFRTDDIVPLIRNLQFKNPNTLEAGLASKYLARPLMSCYSTAKIINLPINKVQTFNNNHAGLQYKISVEDLNRRYINGEQINLDLIMGAQGFNAPHYELPLIFEKK